MGSKKAQTIGYKYYAYGHFVLCHGPIDAITKIKFSDKDAYTNEESENKTIYINKPNLFGGDEQGGGVQGNIDLLFGGQDQEKNATIKKICGDLVSAWRGITSVVFNNVYIGTSPTMPDSKWRVKRIHTLQDGQQQWYDEKAAISASIANQDTETVKTTIYTLDSTAAGYEKINFDDTFGEFGFLLDRNAGLSKTIIEIDSTLINKVIKLDGVIAGAVKRPVLIVDSKLTILEENWVENGNWGFNYNHEVIIPDGNFSGVISLNYEIDKDAWQHTGTFMSGFFNILNRDDALDLNPAHIIRECLTNSLWGKGADSSVIDDGSFTTAADTLYNEGMGMSIVWSASSTIKEFISNVLDHINGELYVDRTTNLWTLKLIREDYDADTLEVINESQYKSLEFERKTLAECVNQVTVTYYDRERAKDSTVAVQDIGRIAQQGGTIAQEVDYKGFTNSNLASRVALRDLKTLSSELATISFDTTEDIAISWNRGHVFKFSSTKYGIDEAIFRITEIKFGDGVDNTVSVEAIEDSFSSPMQSVVEYMPPVKSDISAKDATAIAFEVPYIELVEQYGQDEVDTKLINNNDLSFVGMAAVRPNNYHVNASLYSDSGAGYVEEATLDFCPNATLVTDIGYLDTSFEIENVAEFDNLAVGNRMQIDDEFVAFVSFDSATNILTVKRGVADTVPSKHAANARIYGWDNYSGLDSTEYLSGETVAMKALTLTGSDILSLSEATAHSITCNARAIRPYPPANVKINGEYYPESISGPLTLTWSHRNRTQQTGASYLDWTDSSVTLETGATYVIEVIDGNAQIVSTANVGTVNSYNINYSTIETEYFTIKLYSVRDGLPSFQAFECTLKQNRWDLSAIATSSKVTGTATMNAEITADVDNSLTARMVGDGLSINGTAEAGSTITIEVQS